MMVAEAILILGAAAVQDDAVQSARELGLTTVVCAQAPDGPAVDTCDEFVQLDFLDVDGVYRLMKERGIRFVYSVGSDRAMPVIGELSRRSGSPAFASKEVAETCNNKGLLRRALFGMDGAVPFQVINAFEPVIREVDLPCIVKPVDAQGQRGVAKVDSDNDFAGAVAAAAAHSRTGGVIVERFVGGVEISVNGYLVDSQLVFVAVSDRVVWPQFTGLIREHVVPTQLDNKVVDAVKSLLSNTCARIGVADGPVYAQMKVEDQRPYIIEITPRLDGCHMWEVIKHASGVDLLEATLRHLVFGEIPSFAPTPALAPFELEFVCCKPGLPAPTIEREPGDVAYRAYYPPGTPIRPINGRYEKVGFHLRPQQVRR
jgi:biotin carboxylase